MWLQKQRQDSERGDWNGTITVRMSILLVYNRHIDSHTF